MTTKNTLKTVALLGLLSAILIVGGQALAGRGGMYLGLVFAVVMNFGSYFFSERIALASYSAQPVTPSVNSDVYQRVQPIVAKLCQRMGLPMPKLWLIPQDSPNAFATGRNPEHSSVAFTAGILQLMDDRELEGVVAHELGHVLNRDILTSSIAATIAAAITQLSYMAMFFGGGSRDDDRRGGGGLGALLMLILGPIAATLIQLMISRTREYSADATSAKYTGDPNELISGLQKLDTWSQRVPLEASPATAHLFIIKPFTAGMLSNLFSTHPSTADRIARLRAMR